MHSRVPTYPATQHRALHASWQALWTSRLLVWAAGIYGMTAIGIAPGTPTSSYTAPFNTFGNLLIAPAARWDGGWYLAIATNPYAQPREAAFFPLYPLAMKLLGAVVGSLVLSGIAISLAAFGAALYFLYRLAELEIGTQHAANAVLVFAFFPTAFFFSAIYAESLLLAFSIGAVYAARQGRWALSGILGALASATHNSGILLLVPLTLLYLYGPRADRDPSPSTGPRWRPAYPLQASALWLALVPLGIIFFFAYIGLAHGSPFAPLSANRVYWNRHFAPFAGITQGTRAAWDALSWLVGGAHGGLYSARHGNYTLATWELTDFTFLIGAILATIGVLRRLPWAYGAYCLAALAVGVSAPRGNEPLVSFPRYALVLFPAALWLTLWAGERRRTALCVGVLAVGLGVLTVQFATWRWVA